MNYFESKSYGVACLPFGSDPLLLIEEGLRPLIPAPPEPFMLSVEEVSAMFPGMEILRLVGSGGMGAVYEAVQRDLHRRVALKLLSPALAMKPGLSLRFRHESRLMASLRHPGIVEVYEAGETAEGNLYYIMEFVEGEDLAVKINRSRLSVPMVVELLSHVSGALSAAHRMGIVHRDVKPANILLSKTGPPRLGDFGLALTAAQAAHPLRTTRAGTMVGTLEYAAPEQLAIPSHSSTAGDVYSLGVMTYELLTGNLPKGSFEFPSAINPEVDPAFDRVVLRALQTDPARRFADAGEFRNAFLQAADEEHQQARREKVVRLQLIRRARLVFALLGVSLLTGGSSVVAWKARREADAKRIAAEAAEDRMAGLIQFLLTDLRYRLEPTGNLEAMELVLDKAIEHFRWGYDSSGHSPESALKLADVLVVKADVIGVRGLNDEAGALYDEAIHLTREARDVSPPDLAKSLRVIQAYRDRFEHRMASGLHAAALEDSRAMLLEARNARNQHPADSLLHPLAAAHRANAHALGYTGPLDEAEAEYLEAERLLKQLCKAAPEDQSLANELAELQMSLGSNAEARGDLEKMLEHFTQWHTHVEKNYPADCNYYSHAAFRMGVALQKLGRSEEALFYLQKALAIADRDASGNPGHKGHLNHLSWCVRFTAQAHENLGNTGEAARLRLWETRVNNELAEKPLK